MDRMNLLISDLDGTLLGDESGVEWFAEWFANSRQQFRLVYSSGRFVDSVLESIETSMLPEPDAIIGGVGTQIYDVPNARLNSMWPPSTMDWNPYIVQTIGESFPELSIQPSRFVSRYKVSFYGRDLGADFMERLRWQMAFGGQRATIIYSSNRDLDILPGSVCKGSAAVYLAKRWGISPDRTYVAGDSGNDTSMFHCGFRGIIVGNASQDLKELHSASVYHAVDHHAYGVLEGIRYWYLKNQVHEDIRRWEREHA